MSSEHTEFYLPIMLTLIPQDIPQDARIATRRKLAPMFDWKFIARDVYCRGKHGVFKLEIWSGGTHDAFVGLTGTFIADASGKVDAIDFRFSDLLEPNYQKCTNPNIRPGHPLSIYKREREPWSWYCGLEPVTLKPLHEAILAWMWVWNER